MAVVTNLKNFHSSTHDCSCYAQLQSIIATNAYEQYTAALNALGYVH